MKAPSFAVLAVASFIVACGSSAPSEIESGEPLPVPTDAGRTDADRAPTPPAKPTPPIPQPEPSSTSAPTTPPAPPPPPPPPPAQTCAAIPQTAGTLAIVANATLPVPQGGALVPGTYHVTSRMSVSAALPNPPLVIQATYLFDGGTWTMTELVNGSPITFNGTYGASLGTSMPLGLTCPDVASSAIGYTATPTSLTFIDVALGIAEEMVRVP